MDLQHSCSMKHVSNDRMEGVCGLLVTLGEEGIRTSQLEVSIGVLMVPQALRTGVRWNSTYDSRGVL
jgi:hypothetical protein